MTVLLVTLASQRDGAYYYNQVCRSVCMTQNCTLDLCHIFLQNIGSVTQSSSKIVWIWITNPELFFAFLIFWQYLQACLKNNSLDRAYIPTKERIYP